MPIQDIAAILADTTEFGFTFNLETVKRDDIEYPDTPVMRVTNTRVFDEAFPGVLLKGQSVRVNSQRVGRDCRVKGLSDAEAIKLKNINWLLGVRAPMSHTVEVFLAADGKRYPTELEAQQASLAWAFDKQQVA